MELRHLRYFVITAEELHFTRAAKRIGIAQPPLSQQIQQLEAEIGFPLFYRQARGVSLTNAGADFLVSARAVLDKVQEGLVSARSVGNGSAGLIRIGFTSSAAFNTFVPNAISRYRGLYPDVATTLLEDTTSALLLLMREGALDVAFLRLAAGEGDDLPHRLLFEEEMRIAVPNDSPLAKRTSVPMSELAGQRFVMFPRANGRSLYDAIHLACQAAGFSPDIVQLAPQMASSVSLVAAGIGIALVPLSMCHIHPNGVTYLRVESGGPRALLHVATRELPLSPTAVRFSDLVTREARRMRPASQNLATSGNTSTE